MKRAGIARVLIIGCAFSTASCGSAGTGASNPRSLTPPSRVRTDDSQPADTTRFTTIVARARIPDVVVFPVPTARHPTMHVRTPPRSGPLIFVVLQTVHNWLHVLLPVRPNGSSGWIRRTDVQLSQHDFRIVVELAAHRITVYNGAKVIDREPVGVGKSQTPTPGGVYYTKQLLQPPDASGVYGPFAYQLSGYSDVVTRFNGGNGVIGIHGTNEPWLIGKDVSHGCIRMSNAGITRLAHLLPLGVPVKIRP